MYRSDDNWLCTNDCNFIILFLKCKLRFSFNNITLSEKCLTKFFHIRKPKISNGCIFPVVPSGILRISIFLFFGLICFKTSVQYPLQESNNNTLLVPVLGKKTFISHSLKCSVKVFIVKITEKSFIFMQISAFYCQLLSTLWIRWRRSGESSRCLDFGSYMFVFSYVILINALIREFKKMLKNSHAASFSFFCFILFYACYLFLYNKLKLYFVRRYLFTCNTVLCSLDIASFLVGFIF